MDSKEQVSVLKAAGYEEPSHGMRLLWATPTDSLSKEAATNCTFISALKVVKLEDNLVESR